MNNLLIIAEKVKKSHKICKGLNVPFMPQKIRAQYLVSVGLLLSE